MERSRSLRVANALAWVLIATGIARAAYADSVTLQAVADNTIYEESGDLSNGAGDHFFTGATRDGVTRRALIRFDVAASVPVGSTIESVTLQLYLSRTRTQDQTVSLYRVLAAWGEGTSKAGGEEGAGAPATPGDATWTDRLYPTAPWSTAGGDFAVSASAAAVVGNGTGFFTWASPGMAADVQAWLDGAAADDGWILLGNEASTRVTKRFDSRTNPDATHRPQLVVEFTPPAATGACCAADGSCSVVLDPGTGCAGSYEGVGTSCSPNPCPPPTGACCLPLAAATCLEDTEDACVTQGGVFQGALSACAATSCPVVLEPFVDALPIPAPAQPTSGTVGGAASYTISMREVQQKLHRDLPPTTVWGFGDGPSGATYPGPTLEARTGQPITVTWVNDLRDTSQPGAPLRTSHYLAVDSCPHGAAGNADARTVVHLHGGHVASEFDGNPEATFPPGAQAVYSYPNWQLPATLWYHDHALGITRLNVEMGLAGFYLIRDAFETSLGLPSGEFEIPLVVQDRTFAPDGSLVYPVAWQDHFFGDTILVNGKVWPYLQVKQGKYRFRLLDGSGSRTYRLSLSSGASLQVIGMEGGLLPAPVAVNEVTLGPGERADVVVDFAPYPPGTEVFLVNDAPAPFPGEPGVGVVPDVMKFVVSGEAGSTAPLPATLRPMAVLDEADAARSREFHLEKGPADACSPFRWLVRSVENGTVVGEDWVDVTELPELGTTEVWKFVNKSGLTHPMHMHLVMFQVLDRQAFEIVGGDVVPIGSPVPPPPHEAGWKDTVQVGPNEIVRVIARFEDFAGRFPYHCHILEHEDHEMMRQFETVATTPACENGIDDDGDGRIDFAGGDPGCDAATDVSEHAPNRPCDDGLDNDGDGAADFPADPGCGGPGASREDPQCQDGLDNDHDGSIDFDGGASLDLDQNGFIDAVFNPATPAVGPADPQCVGTPWKNKERSGCGLGFELVLVAPLLARLRRRRQRGA